MNGINENQCAQHFGGAHNLHHILQLGKAQINPKVYTQTSPKSQTNIPPKSFKKSSVGQIPKTKWRHSFVLKVLNASTIPIYPDTLPRPHVVAHRAATAPNSAVPCGSSWPVPTGQGVSPQFSIQRNRGFRGLGQCPMAQEMNSSTNWEKSRENLAL